jgi:hypothetical protein
VIPYTEAFRSWFRDSKVLDEQGQPLVVYHGGYDLLSSARPVFRVSRRGAWGAGIYFTPKRWLAAQYATDHPEGRAVGAVNEYLLRVERPWIADKPPGEYPVVSDLVRLGWTYDKAFARIDAENERHGDIGSVLQNELSKRGYDGMFVLDHRDSHDWSLERDVREILVWDPRQAKSATHNAGTFDPRNPNVLKGWR